MLGEDEANELVRGCTRFLAGHGPTRPADALAAIPADVQVDRYGAGGVVAELEAEVCRLLGKPAAVFLPSGTMAQQSVLRVHADRRGRRTVVWHPHCHLDRHEDRAYQRLHGLVGRPVGALDRLLQLSDLTALGEAPAALLLELPQRDLGGDQPAWDDVVAQVDWAHGRGAAAHLDGARIWESAAGYGKTPAEVAAPFDSVYVSFYKGIGALAGCAVAGEPDVVAEVREWRHRMGGTLWGLWPLAASALTNLGERLPRMGDYLRQAKGIADAVRDLPGVQVVPDPPRTPMMHLLLHADDEQLTARVRRLAVEDKLWTFPRWAPTGLPGVQRVELSIGDATMKLAPREVRDALAALVGA
jgi:threonine aldolase